MVYREEFKVQSHGGQCTFHDVTETARGIAARSGVRDGICVVYSRHTTCCVITDECAFDMAASGQYTLHQDFLDVLEDMIPTQKHEGIYHHPGAKALAFAADHDEDARGCHNADAHLRSSIIGRSETVVVIDGQLDLGQFGHVYFVDLDQTRARTRTVQVMVMGE